MMKGTKSFIVSEIMKKVGISQLGKFRPFYYLIPWTCYFTLIVMVFEAPRKSSVSAAFTEILYVPFWHPFFKVTLPLDETTMFLAFPFITL